MKFKNSSVCCIFIRIECNSHELAEEENENETIPENKVHLQMVHLIFICSNWFRFLQIYSAYNFKYSKTNRINAK